MHYPKVLERVDSPEQIFHRNFSLGAPVRFIMNESMNQRFDDSTIQRFPDSAIQGIKESRDQRINESTNQNFITVSVYLAID